MNGNLKTTMLAASVSLASGCVMPMDDSDSIVEHETGFASANGITIAYESFGPTDRELVLLVAGTG